MAQASAISATGAILIGSLSHNKTRSLLSVLAIALGVALGYAVQLITASAINELALGVQVLSGEADLQVRGPRSGFDENLYPMLAKLAEVAQASPVVEVDAKLSGRDDVLKIVGVDAFRAAVVEPGLIAAPEDRLDLLRSDTLFLSPAARRLLGVGIGDVLRFQVGLHEVPLRVVGWVPVAEQQRLGVMDIAGAQAAFDRVGVITRVDLRLRPGSDPESFRQHVLRELPAGLAVEPPASSVQANASASRSYRVNLNILALVALFTGGLLVFSTQALAVVRRRPHFALLRVLGMTRGQLIAGLLLEGAVLGAVGSALGLVFGFALAQAAIRIVGPDLGSGYFRGVAPTLALTAIALALCFLLGLATAILGSLFPALEAARATPALALKPGDEQRAFVRLRSVWPGVAALAAGALTTLLPPVAGLPLFGYVAIALLLVGTLMLMPRIAAFVFDFITLPQDPSRKLALLQLRGTPGQSAVSLVAIVASLSLMISMAIMVTSFRDALDAWLERVLPADLYVRAAAAGDTGYLAPEDQARIASLPGIRRAEFFREQQLLLDPSRPRIVLLARAISPADAGQRLALVSASSTAAADEPPLWANEAMADLYGFTTGKVVELPLAGKASRFTVAGVWRDYARPQGAVVIERDRYVALTGDHTATNAALWFAPGASLEQISASIAREVPGGARLEIATPGEIRDVSLRIFDRTFAVTYALESAAVAIGLLGLSSSFGALVLARRREFGVLRHIGMTRRQIGAMLAAEGLILSAIGIVAGLLLGMLISLVLIHVVNRQSFHWGMELSLPWTMLALAVLVVPALSTLTAWASGRKAMGDDVVRAVKDDW
ncbi:MAG TPA: FtsX-like permease family protein [Casimicrobiaceae bacterium]|nr:FtsX-like permease family protein [Casimicrobiaceae bacterium]